MFDCNTDIYIVLNFYSRPNIYVRCAHIFYVFMHRNLMILRYKRLTEEQIDLDRKID